MVEQEKLSFYKSNVNYVVGVRFHMKDVQGKILTANDPYVAVKESELRDFKRANKQALQSGLIMETVEPTWDDETPNALEATKAAELVKNVFALKKALAQFTSEIPVRTLLEEAEKQKRPEKTISIIQARLNELVGDEETEPTEPSEMQGVS